MKAFVELITNSDDAYLNTPGTRKGPIRIEVTRRRSKQSTTIRVKDKACGLTYEEMLERLATEGKRTSGREVGRDARGLFGRGAKDIVNFGEAEWESVKDGERTRFRLLYDKAPTGEAMITPLGSAEPREHETTATLDVQPRFAVKRHDSLADALTRHYALRPCLMDREHREVWLVDVNQNRKTHLVYEQPRGEQLADNERIPVPGYEGEYVTVSLWKAGESLDDRRDREYWRHSLLVKSGRAAYEVFVGSFSREPWSLYLPWFFGYADVPGINRLIREFDDNEEDGLDTDPLNPIRLIRRDRRGLVDRSDHKFVDAVYQVLEGFLSPHIERLKEEVESRSPAPVTDQTRRRLREISQALSRFLQHEESGGDLTGLQGNLPPAGLTVIPEAQLVEPGHAGKMTVRYRQPSRNGPEPPRAPVAHLSTTNGVGVLSASELELRDRGEYHSRAFRVDGVAEGEICEVEIRLGDESATCLVQCEARSSPGVEKLEFQHSTYSIKEGRRRNLLILAPWEQVADSEAALTVKTVGDSSIALVSLPGAFGFDERLGCGAAVVSVRGRKIGDRASISATLDDEVAEAELVVAASGGSGVDVKLAPDLPRRALWDGDVLKINASDPSIARYLGRARDDWPGQHSIHFRTMLAEIIAFEAVRRVLESRWGQDKAIPSDVYAEHTKLAERCVREIHSASVPGSELATVEA